jgi:plasmid stabilization system protein ParE
MSGFVLGRDADLDLERIWEYIAEDDIDAADRWIVHPRALAERHRGGPQGHESSYVLHALRRVIDFATNRSSRLVLTTSFETF